MAQIGQSGRNLKISQNGQMSKMDKILNSPKFVKIAENGKDS